ncbi:MAG: SDR family NAD(P)-dependent oxidoreductase [Planctomycetota bacterium]
MTLEAHQARFSLSKLTVAVTGSSTGIGRSIALAMAGAGARVILHGRLMSKELDATHSEIVAAGGKSFPIACDFAEAQSMKGFVDRCWACTGEIHSWVNCAGADILTGSPASSSFLEKLESLWRVDVLSTLLLSRLVGPRMVRMAGRQSGNFSITNIGWDQALHGMEGDNGELFSTTKGAVMAASQSLAQTFAPHVRVNCLAPGWIRTEWGEKASDTWQYRARKQSLMDRWGTPDDVAAAAVWLASPAASFISGQIIQLNGGFRRWHQAPGEGERKSS